MARNYFASETELNWDVKPTEIIVNGVIAPNNFALVRSDNNEILEIHKQSYNPFYNVEFKSLLDDLQKITGFENLAFQEYKGGKTILGYLENNKTDVQINGLRGIKITTSEKGHPDRRIVHLYLQTPAGPYLIQCMAPKRLWNAYHQLFSKIIIGTKFL